MAWAERARARAGGRAAVLRCVLGLAAVVALGGCEDLKRAQDRFSQAVNPAKFGTPTREELKTDAQGTTVRLMIQSKVEADWIDANVAMSRGLRYQCRDGESHNVVQESPSGPWTAGASAMDTKHPAGTTFTQVIQCAAPPPYEFALPAGTTEEAAQEKVRAMLHGEQAPDYSRYTVIVQRFSDRRLKYPTTASALGHLTASRLQDCPAGVTVNRIVLAAHPRPKEGDKLSLNSSYVVLGLDTTCADAPETATATAASR